MQPLQYGKGELPVSMGISLALERLNKMGIKHQESPMTSKEEQVLAKCTHLYVNLRTLYRSVYSALDELSVRPEDMALTLQSEVDSLYLLLDGMVEYKLTPVLYFPTYQSLPQFLPKARINHATTDLQKQRQQLEKDTYTKLPKELVNLVEECDVLLPGNLPNSLMLTHYPVDLLKAIGPDNIALLESNTGSIKTRERFSTKLLKSPDDSLFIPFNKMTLSVFGDQNKLIRSYAAGPKKVLLDIAKRNRWNTLTTPDRIRQTLKSERDQLFARELMTML